MIRRPPRSTQSRSSAASDVYKRQLGTYAESHIDLDRDEGVQADVKTAAQALVNAVTTVSYTHLRAHETVLDLVCRLLLEKKK